MVRRIFLVRILLDSHDSSANKDSVGRPERFL
jgi:hypothetical protein